MPKQHNSPTLATIGDLFKFAVDRFKKANLFYGHGTERAEDEAVYLIFSALSLSFDNPRKNFQRPLSPDEITMLCALIEKRITQRIPTAYLTQKAWQGSFAFYVDERVIVPRSFIFELLGKPISPWIQSPNHVRQALDLCTGSGCLAVQLAQHYPKASIDAVDISVDALAVANINVQQYGLEKQIRLIHGDLFEGIKGKTYDLIVTNPPYVDRHAMSNLPPEYQHEPTIALAAGAHGLDVIERIIANAQSFLNENGILLMEVGHNHALLEKRYPHLAFMWLATRHDEGHVCLLAQSDLAPPYTAMLSV